MKKEKGSNEKYDEDALIVKEARECYNEAKSAIDGWNKEAIIDTNFYLSDQWDAGDAAELIKKKIPVLNLNYLKKTVDLVSGYQRQNRSDLKYYPIENGDVYVSEVLTKIALWVMKSNNSRYYISEAFKDALITGVGWFFPEVDYSKDPINGDIYIRQESPYNLLFDPYFTEMDLSDCSYIIRHKLLNKKKAKDLWPEFADEIEKVKAAKGDTSFRQDADVPTDKGSMVLVWEYWRRGYEDKKFSVDEQGNMSQIDEEDAMELEGVEGVEIVERKMPVMKLAIFVGEGSKTGKPVVVYDDESPYSTTEFPFIPIWCYLTSMSSDWTKKLQGLLRPLRDPQREKNKRRSQIMHIMNTVASSGYDIEKGAYDDINQFSKGGAGKVFQRNRGFNPAMRIAPPDMPASVIQLEQMFSNDISIIGANPDLMGQISEKGAAGITIQLRQKQGMTALQEVFDNLSMAVQKFGRILVDLIIGNFSMNKIRRILGDDIPFEREIKQLEGQIAQMTQQITQGATDLSTMAGRETSSQEEYAAMDQEEKAFEQQLMQQNAQMEQAQMQLQQLKAAQADFWARWQQLDVDSRYDCSVSETIENETHRISVLMALTQAQQYGMPIPLMVFAEYLDLPVKIKEEMKAYVEQQQQAQAQQAQAQLALEEKKVDNQKEIEMIKQGVGLQKEMVNEQTGNGLNA